MATTQTDQQGRASRPAGSQTLARGLRMLELAAQAPVPPTIAELAAGLDVHRSIAYRILRTLEDHGYLRRDDAGRVHPAPALAVLARRVEQDLQAAALPELTAVSSELGMSAFVVVWDADECTTLVTVEPPRGNLVTQRPGTRHPLDRGAPGLAIASVLEAAERETAAADGVPESVFVDADATLTRGFAVSNDEVITGVSSVAVPLRLPGQLPAALAVVYATREADVERLGGRLADGARRIAGALGHAAP